MAEEKRKILLAEDDLSIGELLKNYLEMNDFSVSWYKDGIEAFKGFNKSSFDICLLDVMMPGLNGFELATEIKQLSPQTPLLFITAKTLREDILAGYKCGADDYIVKPFDAELLIYKINAVLKRNGGADPKQETTVEFVLGRYRFNAHLRSLKGPGGERQLSPKETELLKLLCQYKNNVLPRDLALKNIWGNDDYFNGRSMDVYIAKIRKHLKDDPSLEIINIHGKGYRFNVHA
ncbi:MAG TPA: response regulator transcription factor [Bacteroidia bacterium]|jgi:two-component system OmpR family response regulator|nr:response regulator transcription factor [Bacteroidia bacterium]